MPRKMWPKNAGDKIYYHSGLWLYGAIMKIITVICQQYSRNVSRTFCIEETVMQGLTVQFACGQQLKFTSYKSEAGVLKTF